MKEFFTKEANSTPQKLPLKLNSGEDTGEYLMLVGTESDVFRFAQAKVLREGALKASSGEYDEELAKKLDLILVSSLIDSWSFDKECNEENKIYLLDNAPFIRDAINAFGANQGNFIKK